MLQPDFAAAAAGWSVFATADDTRATMAGRGVALGRLPGLEQPLYSVKQVHGVAGAPAQGGPQQPQQRSRGAAVQQNPRGARFVGDTRD